MRGLAILLVLIRHLTVGIVPASTADGVVRLLGRVGWIGVDLFFVLSGFLITGILYDARAKTGYFRDFYIRRSLRIFPLYYGVLLFLLVLLPLVAPGLKDLGTLVNNQAWYWTYTTNILAVVGAAGATPLGTDHFWSLAVEEQFYLIWPVVVFVCSRRALLRVCGCCIVAALGVRVALILGGAGSTAPYVLMPSRMDALAMGGAIAVLARDRSAFLVLARVARPAMLVSGSTLVGILGVRGGLDRDDPVVMSLGYSLLAIFFGGLLVAALTSAPRGTLRRFLQRPSMLGLGKYSYGIYVFHYPIIGAVVAALGGWASVPVIAGSRLPAQIVLSLILFSGSLAAAWLSFHMYEKWFLMLKDRLAPPRRAGMAVPHVTSVASTFEATAGSRAP